MTSRAALILKLMIVVIGTICTSIQAGGTSSGVSSWHEEKVNIYNCSQTQQHLWYRKRLLNSFQVIMDSNVDSSDSIWTRFKFGATKRQMFGIKKTDGQWFFMQPVGNKLRLIKDDYPNNVPTSDNRVFIVRREPASQNPLIRHENTNTYLSHYSSATTSRLTLVKGKSLAMPMCFRVRP